MNSENSVIIAVSKNGALTACRIKKAFPASALFIPEKFKEAPECGQSYYSCPVKELIGEAFNKYNALILVMASGIAVRSIAPYLNNKKKDPAVVVLDEAGNSVISLISGHVGGANELACLIAKEIGATPVITTASDTQKTISADILGKEHGWMIEGEPDLTSISASIVNGGKTAVVMETGEASALPERLPQNVKIYKNLAKAIETKPKVLLFCTDRILDKDEADFLPPLHIIYRPKSLVIGIGCNRGTPSGEIKKGLFSILNRSGLSPSCISSIASVEAKKDEEGLLKLAESLSVPITFYKAEELNAVETPSKPSEHALKYVGCGSVAEASAILASGYGQLIEPKTAFGRSITLSIYRKSQKRKPCSLSVIGIGPGDAEVLTPEAKHAICESQVIVGYKNYVKLIENLAYDKEVYTSGMTREIERVQKAIDEAVSGKDTALICSGDSGIYGLSGLAFELKAKRRLKNLKINIIPGVPALASCSSLLGAPLVSDFCVISLSDYLVKWKDIEKRLENAAKSGFIIILQNPKSKKRPFNLGKACDIITKYRSKSTPCGIVANAYREGQRVETCTLGELPNADIDMNTTVFIGGENTFIYEGKMITKRGYGDKYEIC